MSNNQAPASLTANAVSDLFSPLPLRSGFSRSLHQSGRLLQLHLAALPPLTLIPLQASITEAISQPFSIVLDAISTSAHIELKSLLGESAVLHLLQADRLYRRWHAHITAAQYLGSDGGMAHYRLHVHAWLHALAHSGRNRVFQDLNALQIIEAVFADHPWAQWRVEATRDLPVRSTCTQYQESDLAFVQRLLAQEGLTYVFEQPAPVAESALGSPDLSAAHVLLIRDAQSAAPDAGTVRFSSAHPSAHLLSPGKAHADTVTAFMAQRRATPTAVALASWDYKQLLAPAAELDSALDLGELPDLQQFDGSGAYRFKDTEQAQGWSERALQALELDAKRFEGAGQTRHFAAGSRFCLIDHPLYGANSTARDYADAVLASHQRPDNAFTLLGVHLQVRNNLGGQLAGSWLQRALQAAGDGAATGAAALSAADAAQAGEYGQCLVRFACCAAAAPIVPRHWPRPTAHGLQSAVVVGLPPAAETGEADSTGACPGTSSGSDSPLHTERGLRVRVRFAWQPEAAPAANGADAASAPSAAQTDACASTWVRVAQPAAGANWGWALPFRIGTEVAVEFIEGDIDRPVIVGALYNGQDAPPFAAGIDSGANHPGIISGWHVPDVAQEDFAQWVLDDASGQLRMRLLASYTAAEVGLGHLITQGAAARNGPAVRGAWRGLGFEAGTQGWQTLRAPKGLLLSSTLRRGDGVGSARGCQMDAQEAIACLQGAQELASTLDDAARISGTLGVHASTPPGLAAHVADVDAQQRGKHAPQVNGQVAQVQDAARNEIDAVPAFANPHVLLDAATSRMAWATQGSLMQYAAGSMLHVAQGDMHQVASAVWTATSGAQAGLFAAAGDFKAVAANAPVWLRAHSDAMQVQAKGDIEITSTEDCIEVQASDEIELIGGNSRITLKGADITFACPNTFTVKSSQHAFLPPAAEEAAMGSLPSGQKPLYDQAFVLIDKKTGKPLAHYPYRIKRATGAIEKGVTDASGRTHIVSATGEEALTIEYEEE